MAVVNEPKIKNPLIVAIREQLEHRALKQRKKGWIPANMHRQPFADAGCIRGQAYVRKQAALIP